MFADVLIVSIFAGLVFLLWNTRRSRKRGVSLTSENTHNLFWLSNRNHSDGHSSNGGGEGGGA